MSAHEADAPPASKNFERLRQIGERSVREVVGGVPSDTMARAFPSLRSDHRFTSAQRSALEAFARWSLDLFENLYRNMGVAERLAELEGVTAAARARYERAVALGLAEDVEAGEGAAAKGTAAEGAAAENAAAEDDAADTAAATAATARASADAAAAGPAAAGEPAEVKVKDEEGGAAAPPAAVAAAAAAALAPAEQPVHFEHLSIEEVVACHLRPQRDEWAAAVDARAEALEKEGAALDAQLAARAAELERLYDQIAARLDGLDRAAAVLDGARGGTEHAPTLTQGGAAVQASD